jgi:uncharacterized protein YoxC
LGISAIVALFIAIRFEPGERTVPLLFLLAELAVAGTALARMFARATDLAASMDGETAKLVGLAKQGASLADCLSYVADCRRDATEKFQEQTATWANLLIVTGMVGTAGYMVTHAADFMLKDDSKETSEALFHLLLLAPKAFLATGLALACAAILGLSGGRVFRLQEAQASQTNELIDVWCAQQRARDAEEQRRDQQVLSDAIIEAFNDRIVTSIAQLPKSLNEAIERAGASVASMAQAVTGLTGSLNRVTKHFEQVAETSNAYMDESHKIMSAIVRLEGDASQLLAVMKDNGTSLTESVRQAIAEMRHLFDGYQRDLATKFDGYQQDLVTKFDGYQQDLMNKASAQAPDLVKLPLERAVTAIGTEMNKQAHEIVTYTRKQFGESYGQAQRAFETAIAPTSKNLSDLAAHLSKIDESMTQLGSTLDAAAASFPRAVQQVEVVVHSLAAAIQHLGQDGAAGPTSVAQLCKALESASQRLTQATEGITAQTTLLAKIEAEVS